MIAAVLDTNVLASGVLGLTRPNSVPGELLRRWQEEAFTLVVSEHILAELARTLADRYVVRRLSADAIAGALRTLGTDAMFQSLTIRVQGVATQPNDDLVLSAALSAGVEYLATSDRRLQEIGSYRGVSILSPRQFLEILELKTGGMA